MTFSELHSRFLAALHYQLDNGVFTERQLARLARISQPHCHHILAGHRQGTLAMLDRLAAAAGIDLAALLTAPHARQLRHELCDANAKAHLGIREDHGASRHRHRAA